MLSYHFEFMPKPIEFFGFTSTIILICEDHTGREYLVQLEDFPYHPIFHEEAV